MNPTISRTGRKLQRDYHESITSTQTVNELLRFLSLPRAEPFDVINHATALYRLGTLSRKFRKPVPVPEELKITRFGPDWKPRAISNALWAAGALDAHEVVQEDAVPKSLNGWVIKDVVNGLWGLVASQHAAAPRFLEMAEDLISDSTDSRVTAIESALFCWSRARICPNENFPHIYESLIYEKISEMEFRELAMTVWAFGKTNSGTAELWRNVSERVKILLESERPKNPQAIANFIWGFSECNVGSSGPLLDIMRDHINLTDCNPEQTSMILTSYAREALSLPTCCGLSFDGYKCRELVNVVWALSRYACSHESSLLSAIRSLITVGRSELTHEDIYTLSRALASAYYSYVHY